MCAAFGTVYPQDYCAKHVSEQNLPQCPQRRAGQMPMQSLRLSGVLPAGSGGESPAVRTGGPTAAGTQPTVQHRPGHMRSSQHDGRVSKKNAAVSPATAPAAAEKSASLALRGTGT